MTAYANHRNQLIIETFFWLTAIGRDKNLPKLSVIFLPDVATADTSTVGSIALCDSPNLDFFVIGTVGCFLAK